MEVVGGIGYLRNENVTVIGGAVKSLQRIHRVRWYEELDRRMEEEALEAQVCIGCWEAWCVADFPLSTAAAVPTGSGSVSRRPLPSRGISRLGRGWPIRILRLAMRTPMPTAKYVKLLLE